MFFRRLRRLSFANSLECLQQRQLLAYDRSSLLLSQEQVSSHILAAKLLIGGGMRSERPPGVV